MNHGVSRAIRFGMSLALVSSSFAFVGTAAAVETRASVSPLDVCSAGVDEDYADSDDAVGVTPDDGGEFFLDEENAEACGAGDFVSSAVHALDDLPFGGYPIQVDPAIGLTAAAEINFYTFRDPNLLPLTARVARANLINIAGARWVPAAGHWQVFATHTHIATYNGAGIQKSNELNRNASVGQVDHVIVFDSVRGVIAPLATQPSVTSGARYNDTTNANPMLRNRSYIPWTVAPATIPPR